MKKSLLLFTIHLFGSAVLCAQVSIPWGDVTERPTTLGGYGITDAQPYDADLADLADGSLTGSKVGTGINGTNITTGTVADARLSGNIPRLDAASQTFTGSLKTVFIDGPWTIYAGFEEGGVDLYTSGGSTRMSPAYLYMADDSDSQLEVTLDGIAVDGIQHDWPSGPASAFATTAQLGIPLIKPYALAASPCIQKVDADTVEVKAGTRVVIDQTKVVHFAADTTATIDTGSLAAGTDYAIYAIDDGTAVFSASFSGPTGHDAGTYQLIGGFHFSPGGNATGYNTGGDTTPAVNEYSIWDLKFRPSCPDPRGMALVAGRFWVDIYLMNTDCDVNGTSRNNATIADGSSAPKVPAMFGGNGSTTYGTFTWYEAAELAAAYGKQLLSYDEAVVAFFGAKEAAARGNDPVTTGLGTANSGSSNTDEKFTSIWGVIQCVGVMWQWGRDMNFIPHQTALTGSPPADSDFETWITAALTGSYKAITESRGSVYTYGTAGISAGRFGGYWSVGSNAGSRASSWSFAPSDSNASAGARARCDHLVLP